MRSLLTSETPTLLSVGLLVLDTEAHELHGPAGRVDLDLGPYLILRDLMRRPGAIVSLSRLIEAAWPDADMEPGQPEQAIRQRVLCARKAMASVGVPGNLLALKFQLGYRLDGEPRVVRTFSPDQAAAVDQWIAERAAA